MADFIPTVTLKSKFPPWFDADVKRALREKESAHREKKKSPTDENISVFSERQRRFKSIVSSKCREYILHLVDDFKSSSKRFWSLPKSIKPADRSVPVLKCDGRTVTDDVERRNVLVGHSQPSFRIPLYELSLTVSYDIDNLDLFTVVHETVLGILRSFNVHKAC